MPTLSPKILWLRVGRPDGHSRGRTEALMLSGDGSIEPAGEASGNLRKLPWDDLDMLLIDASIPRGRRLRIHLAKRRFAPRCLAVLLMPDGSPPPKISPFSLVDHVFREVGDGDDKGGCPHRETPLPPGKLADPTTLAKRALELLTAERRTVLWIDPNLTCSSPATRHLLYAVPTLRALGWKVRGWGYACDLSPTEIDFLELPSVRLPRPLSILSPLIFEKTAKAALGLYQLLKGRRPASILHCGYISCPDIVSVHFHIGEWLRISRELEDPSFKDKLRRLLSLFGLIGERRIYANSEISQFWPASHSIGDVIRRDGVPPTKIHVLSNSYDATRFNPENKKAMRNSARDELNYHDDQIVFGFAGFGNFTRKGLWLAVDAIVDLAGRPGLGDVRLLVIGGNDSAMQEARAKIEDRHGREALTLFTFTGTTDRPEYYFAACDGFLFPSYFEACALVCVEASAMGIPLFVTPHHGHEMYLAPGENGELIEWDARAIANVLAHSIAKGLEGYRHVAVETWTREAYAKELEQRYRAFITDRENAPPANATVLRASKQPGNRRAATDFNGDQVR